MIGVYKITSPSGRIYIGGSKNIERRFYLYQILYCKQQIKLYNSFLKYGVSNHVFEIICECNLTELRKLEAYYGNLYNVLDYHIGLNIRLPQLNENYEAISDEGRRNISAGVLKAYDRYGRKSEQPGYEENRLKKKRERQNKKYQQTRAKTKEENFNNRSSASKNGWLNPNRQVKKRTTEQIRAYHREYLRKWRQQKKAA